MLFFHLLLFNPPASDLIGQSQQVMLPFYWSSETHLYNIINIVWVQQLIGWADGVPSEGGPALGTWIDVSWMPLSTIFAALSSWGEAWECHKIPQEEPESVAWAKDVSSTLFSLLLLRPNHT